MTRLFIKVEGDTREYSLVLLPVEEITEGRPWSINSLPLTTHTYIALAETIALLNVCLGIEILAQPDNKRL